MKLSVRLPLLVVGAVTVTSVVGGGIAVKGSEQSLRRQSIASDRRSLLAYSSAITSYLENATSTLAVVAADSAGAGGVEPLRTRARTLAQASSVFEFVAVVGRDCVVSLIEPEPIEAGTSRRDWSFLPWCREATATGRAVVSDLHVSPVTQNPSVVVAVPATGDSGTAAAVWAGALRLETLSALASVEGADPANAGYGFVTDRRGLVIAHHANADYVRYQTDFSSVPPVARALRGESGTGGWRNPIEDSEKLGAYLQLPSPGWAVVYSTSRRAALAPARRLARAIQVTFVAVVALVGSASIWIVRRTLRPLRRLGEATERVAAGDLSQSIHVAGHDEVAELGTRFNTMVTALDATEHQLRARAAELERAVEDLDAFSYSVAHDLRTPLRAIDGFAKIIQDESAGALDARAQGYFRRIRTAAQRMGRLIDDLLTLSRVGRVGIRRERLDLSRMAGEVVAELARAEHGRRVTVEIRPGLVTEGDPRLVRTLLETLLENAWKFTMYTEEARIELLPAGAPGCFVLRDNGAGFDMAYAGKLFSPFQRLHAQSDFPGTGVGLASARRIVLLHGGCISAQGAVGGGATFTFSLTPEPTGSTAAGQNIQEVTA